MVKVWEAAIGGILWRGVLTNFAIFTARHLYWSLFLIKLQTFRHVSLLKKGSDTGVNIAKFLRIPIWKNIYEHRLKFHLFSFPVFKTTYISSLAYFPMHTGQFEQGYWFSNATFVSKFGGRHKDANSGYTEKSQTSCLERAI